ncbi:bestrophin family ion channel [Mucilaginibacter sp. cycad4]|uniref:bestrophin family protein n=1 Tax=Mucilaginibacter sp. cycad4 TaxID=3342096 RepID=UPI002AAA8EBF|nr:bestrophin family ion channel [Mucilaginibacter gossypii]WPV01866.1 bestrophin family ion channel [Mucilaginibacter gossypii]
MVYYNPKEWFSFIFKINKAETLRELFPLMIAVGAYAGVVTYFLIDFWQLPDTSILKKVIFIHQTIGFVFSLLLAFRINSAYDRWWEGRKIWGSLVNNSRNLAIKLKHLISEDELAFFNYAIPRYARALRDHLRDEYVPEEQSFVSVDAQKHVPNQVASEMIKNIYRLNKEGVINPEQLFSITAEITSFTDICGACERIKKTPIPFSYNVFIKKFIFTYIMTLPFTWAFDLKYFIIPIICFVLFVFASIELLAEEIEDPFGRDANDLPLDSICENIQKHVGELIG